MNKNNQFDVIVIGGGATGFGVALESATRGYSTLLLEASDYGKGTSSKSTKLVHGGIRYLANFDFELVKEGLEERYYFLKNAPHLAHKQSYLIPLQNLFEKIQYNIGIRLYDYLAGSKKLGQSKFLSKEETFKNAPQLKANNLSGGAIYFDGQFDDTRMLMTLLHNLERFGGCAYNYHKVTDFIKDISGKIIGVSVLDIISNKVKSFHAKVIINATGTFTDTVLDMDDPSVKHHVVTAAQGTHLVFDKNVFKCDHALVIPKTADGRILFVLPWYDKIVVGTTDVAVDLPTLDPKPMDQEINFILDTFNQHLVQPVSRADIRSVFAGQRPLVSPQKSQSKSAKISRKHEVMMSDSGLITCVGGKWTIYRRMGEDAIDFAIKQGKLLPSNSITSDLLLCADKNNSWCKYKYPLSVYGDFASEIANMQLTGDLGDKIHPHLPYTKAEIVFHITHEHAKTIEDILARRTRALFLDAKATIEVAPLVAQIMASLLKLDDKWIDRQLQEFNLIANQYIPL